MKFSDLSWRNYIALEVLPAVVQQCAGDTHLGGISIQTHFARSALEVADAMLIEMGLHDREIENLKAKDREAETALEAMRPHWALGYSSDSIAALSTITALSEIWEVLGATNQTEAMEKLRALVP